MNDSSEPERPAAYAPRQRAMDARRTAPGQTSSRRMSTGRRIWYWLIITLGRGVLRLFWSSCRLVAVVGEQHLDQLRDDDQPGIAVYWHQMHIMVSNYLLRRLDKGDRIGFLISPSVSGEVPAAVARRWGATVVRGSSSRTGAQALRDVHLALKKNRLLIALNPDGPKGPIHEFKTGAILLSRMAGAPIVPMAYAASRCTWWNSWDRFLVPWPFSRVAIVIGEPVQIPRGGGAEQLADWQRELEAIMAETYAAAERALDG
jgi:lysophospholipid acyltransferase (LPLAT)-like uncharacterized protein